MDQVECRICYRFYSSNEEHLCPAKGQNTESPISAEEEIEKINFHESTSDVSNDSFSKSYEASSKRKLEHISVQENISKKIKKEESSGTSVESVASKRKLEDISVQESSSKKIKNEKESSDTSAENVSSERKLEDISVQESSSEEIEKEKESSDTSVENVGLTSSSHTPSNTPECSLRSFASDCPDGTELQVDSKSHNVSENVARMKMDAEYIPFSFSSVYFQNFRALFSPSGLYDSLETILEPVENELLNTNILTENAEPGLTSNENSVSADSDNGSKFYVQKVSPASTSENEESHLDAISPHQLQIFSGSSDSSPDSTRSGGDNVQAQDAKKSDLYIVTFRTTVSNVILNIRDVDENGNPIAGPSGIRTQPQRNVEKKRIKCDECGRGFANKYNLKTHLQRHRNEKLYKCPICDEEFLLKYSFKDHVQTHKVKSRFTCHLCSKVLGTQEHLDSHVLRHSEVRPFVCEKCGKSFKDKSTWKRHVQAHDQEKHIVCDVCGMTFHYHQTFTAHFRKMHAGK